jgi:2-hydroxychromene-2-carboxylate isomerase
VDVDLYADPSCPWSWAAATWLEEVAPRRQLRLHHRPFSLALRDGTGHLPAPLRQAREGAHRALRVAAAISDGEARWAFYTALTRPVYAAMADGRPPAVDIAAAARAAGLDPLVAARADDPALDEAISESMRTVDDLLPAADGHVQRIPVLVLAGAGACHGPLLNPAPHGAAALHLWDAVEALLRQPGFVEVSRPRLGRHQLVAAAAGASTGGHA